VKTSAAITVSEAPLLHLPDLAEFEVTCAVTAHGETAFLGSLVLPGEDERRDVLRGHTVRASLTKAK
jgi:hypothetical protein